MNEGNTETKADREDTRGRVERLVGSVVKPVSKRCYGIFTEEDAKKVIPKGCYCYAESICPFWERFHQMPEQENGYCHYMKSGDWEEEGSSLLWDMCKECGINDDEE